MAQPNWVKIRARYERGGIGHRDLAESEGVSYPTLRDRARREGWTVSKAKTQSEIVARTSQKVIERSSNDAADYVAQHTDDWQALRKPIMDLINADWITMTEEALEELRAKAALAMGASKLFDSIQKGQRLSLGLDKPEPPKPPDDGKTPLIVVPPDSDDWKQHCDTGSMGA